jgi:hypothetical protein
LAKHAEPLQAWENIQMPSPLFELINWTDLLQKAKADFSELDEQVNSYDLFNCLCTVNHISDWIEKDSAVVETVKQAASNLAKNNQRVYAVRQLCNRAKHFERKDSSPNTNQQSGYGAGRYGKGSYGIGEPTYEVEVCGEMVNVLKLMRDVIGEWEKLL